MPKWLVVPNQMCHLDRDAGVVANQRVTETGCGSPHKFEKRKCAGHECGRAVIPALDFRHQEFKHLAHSTEWAFCFLAFM